MINPIPMMSVGVTKSDTNYITAPLRTAVREDAVLAASVNVSTDVITYTSLSYANGDLVTVTDAGTTDLSVSTATTTYNYYVVNVSGNTFKLSLTIGGSAVNIGGANTTPPTIKRIEQVTTQKVNGTLYVGTLGDVVYLPTGHLDTNDATVQAGGAQIAKNVSGDFVMDIKKVFSTGTTATDMILKFNP